MKKFISALLSFMLLVSGTAAFADTTLLTSVLYVQDFENYNPSSVQNSISGEDAKGLKISSYGGSSNRNYEDILVTDVSGTILKINLRFYIEERPEGAGNDGLMYFQFKDGSALHLQAALQTSGSGGSHDLKVGSTVLISKDDLKSDDFNNVTLIADTKEQKLYSYLEGTLKSEYAFSVLGAGADFSSDEENKITSVRIYNIYAVRTQDEEDGQGDCFIDEISFEKEETVEYDAENLSQSFEAQMEYTESDVQIKITDGNVSVYLGQEMRLCLIKAEDDTDITEVGTAAAKKAQSDNSGTFEISSALPESITPGYYYVNVSQWIDGEKKHESQKRLYIATAEHLASLPGDFSNLPDDVDEAKSVVESYLPCFLTDEQISELFPKEDDSYTPKGDKNLAFITKYFKNCENTFAAIGEVQEEFEKAKLYLNLKNALSEEDTKAVLAKGGYLDAFTEDEVYSENEEEFFTHFNCKRLDEENPLISDEEIKTALRYAYALTALNSAKRSEIENLVKKYNDIYLIDLAREGIDKVNSDSLYSSLYDRSYTSVSKIDEDFKKKLSELLEIKEKEENSKPNKRPSSGGGGGIRKQSVTTDIAMPKPEIVPQMVQSSVFDDTKNHWAEKEIELLYKNGIIKGFENGIFKPENTLTRAEMVTMLARILPGEEQAENIFADVSESDWYCLAVKEAYKKGIITGTDGKFLPNEEITREQLFAMIFRALNVNAENPEKEPKFADSEEISDYAVRAVAYLAEKGMISGYPDNTLRPKNNTSRAEAVKLLCTAFPDIIK